MHLLDAFVFRDLLGVGQEAFRHEPADLGLVVLLAGNGGCEKLAFRGGSYGRLAARGG
jgi:hypothetical protein